MKKTDLLVIGGSAGGILSATMARKAYGDIDITVIRDTDAVMVPCGIPYIYGTLRCTSKNVIPDKMLLDAKVNLVVGAVVKIDKENKIVTTKNNDTYNYKKLIIATGSLPIIPTFIPGHDLENVFPIYKNQEYLESVLEELDKAQNVSVIGGGFIGVEFAEQISLLGKNVTLLEMAESCLWQAFDKSYSDDIENMMKEKGINVLTSTKVKKIVGEKKVEAIELESGEKIPTDLVILGLGVKPNSILAKEAGLDLTPKGAIVVDQYTRTSDPDIFAVGDCAEKKCFLLTKMYRYFLLRPQQWKQR